MWGGEKKGGGGGFFPLPRNGDRLLACVCLCLLGWVSVISLMS